MIGRNNVDAVISYLKNTTLLGHATEVLISGSSAGGMGTFHGIDQWADALAPAKVIGAPQAGWFFPRVATYTNWTQGHVDSPYTDDFVQLWQTFLHPVIHIIFMYRAYNVVIDGGRFGC